MLYLNGTNDAMYAVSTNSCLNDKQINHFSNIFDFGELVSPYERDSCFQFTCCLIASMLRPDSSYKLIPSFPKGLLVLYLLDKSSSKLHCLLTLPREGTSNSMPSTKTLAGS